MVGLTAPARRVGLMLNPEQMTEDRDAAWLLFEAAINWCTDPAAVPHEPKVSSLASVSASTVQSPQTVLSIAELGTQGCVKMVEGLDEQTFSFTITIRFEGEEDKTMDMRLSRLRHLIGCPCHSCSGPVRLMERSWRSMFHPTATAPIGSISRGAWVEFASATVVWP